MQRQFGEQSALGVVEGIGPDHERAGFQFGKISECSFDFCFRSRPQNFQLYPEMVGGAACTSSTSR
jgi:hypothetical protein